MDMKTKKLRIDTLLKDYYTNNEHFSDMVNAVIFHGEQNISPHMISEYDTSASTFYDENRDTKTIDRDRDVIKKITDGDKEILVGIENQGQVAWNMPFRMLEYNFLTQSRQWHQINNETERIQMLPIKSISFTLYYGENGWSGPRTYDESMKNVPAAFEDLARYKMQPITDIISLDYHKFKNKDNRDMVKGLQMLYQWKGDVNVFKGMVVSKSVALIIAAHANNEKLYEMIVQHEKEEINMCESMRLYTERIMREGEAKGTKKGETIGIAKGETLGMIDTLIQQLNYRFGKLSESVIDKIQNSSKEQLNKLIIKVFDIQNEEDVLKIIE